MSKLLLSPQHTGKMGLNRHESQPRIQVQFLFSLVPDVTGTRFKPLCLCAVPDSLELSEVRQNEQARGAEKSGAISPPGGSLLQCLSPRQRDLGVEFFCLFGTPSNRERKNPSNSEILFQFSIVPWLTSPIRLPPSTPTYLFLLSTLHLPVLSHSLTKYRYLISSPSDIAFM